MLINSTFPRGRKKPDLKDGLSGTSYWHSSSHDFVTGRLWLGRDGNGKPVGIDDNRHIVTVAGSRAGKGTSLIVPNLMLYPGSTVVIDPKGENAALTARNRASLPNHKVIVLDPFDEAKLSDELRGAYNPLDLIDQNSDEAIDLAGALASALVMRTNDKDAHWDESAKQLIEALILHVCESEDDPERRTLARVYQLLMRGDQEFADMIDAEAMKNGQEPPELATFKALWMHMATCEAENENVRDVIIGASQTIEAMGESERGSVLSTARRNTRFLGTPRIQRTLGRTTFQLDELKTHPGGVSVYLCLPARYLSSHARFLRLIVNQVLFQMEAIGLAEPASGHPVLFVLDEFAALGHMETIEKAAGLMAGYGIKLWPILQDLTQLKRHYRESWETFLGNAGTLTFFGNTDLTTLDWLSKRMGQTEITIVDSSSSSTETKGNSEQKGRSRSTGKSEQDSSSEGASDMAPMNEVATVQGGTNLLDMLMRRTAKTIARNWGQSRSESRSETDGETENYTTSRSTAEGQTTNRRTQAVPLMSPQEIASFFDRDEGTLIAFLGGHGPYAVERTPYFKDPLFKRDVVA